MPVIHPSSNPIPTCFAYNKSHSMAEKQIRWEKVAQVFCVLLWLWHTGEDFALSGHTSGSAWGGSRQLTKFSVQSRSGFHSIILDQSIIELTLIKKEFSIVFHRLPSSLGIVCFFSLAALSMTTIRLQLQNNLIHKHRCTLAAGHFFSVLFSPFYFNCKWLIK